MRNYVAYGLNMDISGMGDRCPNSIPIGIGFIKNYNLYFKGCATIEKEEGKEVPVLIWRLNKAGEKRLDKIEGYPNYYKKEIIEVNFNDKIINAMVYIMNEEIQEYEFSESYIERLVSYYDNLKIDLKYLEQFIEDTKKKDNRLYSCGIKIFN